VPIGNANTPTYLQDGIVDGVNVFDGYALKTYDLEDVGVDGNGNWVASGGESETDQWSFRDVAIKQVADNSSNVVALVQITQGATGISITASDTTGCWNADYASIQSDTLKLLEMLENRYNDFMSFANLLGVTVNLKAMFWHQGEKDTPDAANYSANWQNVINKIRTFTGDANFPIIYGTIPTASDAYNSTIETAQLNIASGDANLYCRDNSALTLLDAVHLDALSSESFGDWAFTTFSDNY